jgi:hypothetical protein
MPAQCYTRPSSHHPHHVAVAITCTNTFPYTNARCKRTNGGTLGAVRRQIYLMPRRRHLH